MGYVEDTSQLTSFFPSVNNSFRFEDIHVVIKPPKIYEVIGPHFLGKGPLNF